MSEKEKDKGTTRRDFMKIAAMGGAFLGLQGAVLPRSAEADSSGKQMGGGSQLDTIIDFHAHVYPPSFKAVPNRPPSLFDVERLFAQQKEAEVNTSVISYPMFGAPGKGPPPLDELKEWNDFAGEFAAKSKGRIVALACTNAFGGTPFIKEVERRLREGGFKGIAVNSSVKGDYLESPKAFPLYELACELDVPIFVHPPGDIPGADKMREFRLVEMLGRPFDTTLSIARLILFGVLDRFPNLKLVAAHMGGALPMLPGRLDFGYALRKDVTFGPWEPDVLLKPPSQYLSQIYVDSMGFHPAGVLCALATVGVEHVVLGSDFPPVNIPLKRSVDVIRNLPLAEQDQRKILGGNAARLLKLQKPA